MSYKKDILKGTAILTGVGIITKILGMVNRVYLANLISAEQLGIYQMIFPILLICSAISAFGIQNAISRMVAGLWVQGQFLQIKCLIRITLTIALGLAILLSLFVYYQAQWLSVTVLKEPGCMNYLKLLAFVMPFSTIHTCLCGYFLGMQRAGVPAISQLLEQVIRVLSIFVLSLLWSSQTLDASLAIYGMFLGEMASAAYTVFAYKTHSRRFMKKAGNVPQEKNQNWLMRELSRLAIPLTLNKLLLSVMQSALAIMIPWLLKAYYGNSTIALSIFGVLTGMSLPFITFPNTMTNALASMLLPAVSMAHARRDMGQIRRSISKSLEFCLYTGILAMGGFLLYGQPLGEFFFKSTMAGLLLQLFAYICPFIYITATLSSALNGMGKARATLCYNMASLALQMCLLWLLVPKFGLKGYLWALLAGNLLLCFLNIRGIVKITGLTFDCKRALLLPGSLVCLSGFIVKTGEGFLLKNALLSGPVLMFACGGAFCLIYFMLLYKTGAFNLKEVR